MMDNLLQDLRYALRTLRRSPGFALVAVLTLALGIGANSAIFSVVDTLLLRPLPYGEPERLVTVTHFYPSLDNLEAGFAAATFRDVQEDSRVFENVAVQSGWGVNLTGEGEPQRLQGTLVSGEFFQTLRVPAALGRPILPDDAGDEGNRVVVLSHGLWQRLFGGRADAIGRTVQLNDRPYEVIGVMPPTLRDFFNPGAELWAPIRFNPSQFEARTNEFLTATARLRPGATVADARREMAAFAERLKADHPGSYPTDWTLRTHALDDVAKGDLRTALLVLLGAVGFVLLIACANVANLFLARAAARSKEVAIRYALGARRSDVVRQLLAESLVLSLIGGAFALLIAYGGIRLLVALNPANLPALQELAVDGRVILFTAAVAVLTSLLFGLVPAIHSSRTNLQGTLKQGGRSASADGAGQWLRRGLVASQVALALTLLVGAGLLTRSFASLQRVDPGFSPENVLTLNISLPAARYPSDTARVAFWDALLPRVAAIPGVQGAGAISGIPFGPGGGTRSFAVEGMVLGDNEPNPWGAYRVVDPDFYRTLRIPLIQGRFFTAFDRQDSPPVAIVDRELANRYWPGDDPIGKRVAYQQDEDGEPLWIEVVGVVGHIATDALDADPRVQLYRPYSQVGPFALSLAVRTQGRPAAAVGAVRAAVQSVDPNQPIAQVRTLEELLAASVGPRRFSTVLLGVFAAVALLLASVGIYGVMSFDVNRRVQEVGVRMALGARPGRVVGLILWRGVTLAAFGVGVGLLGAVVLTRLLGSQLHGVEHTDPLTFTAVTALLLAVAILATLVPAWRAARVDPIVAMRAE
jgi:putative ABC transport system permease protein